MKKWQTVFTFIIAVFVVGGITLGWPIKTSSPLSKLPPAPPPIPPSSSVVQFQSNQAKQQFVQANNLTPDQLTSSGSNTYVISKTPDQLTATPGSTAQPNYVYHALATPNDPLYPQWYTTKISAPAAWDVTTGSSSVTVAVLDTGFDLTHQDLSGRFVAGYDFINNDSDPSIDKSSLTGSCTPNDLRYHGTATAGLIGATGNNGEGVASLDWDSKIMPVEVLDDSGCGTTASVVAGINFAVANGANIISMSLGQTSDDPTLKAAIDAAITAGVTVVAAAGNCGGSDYASNNCASQGQMVYPANYSDVIAVGATNQNDVRASYSSYGPNLDVMAPGDASGSGSDVMRTPFWDATNPNAENEYTLSLHGTSFAAPVVAGLAALIKSEYSSATPANIAAIIQDSADKVAGMNGANQTDQYGFGRINARAALTGGATNIAWNFENLDGGNDASVSSYTNAVGKYPAVVNLGGAIHAFYYDATSGLLRHAWNDGSWHFENLDGAGGANGRITANVGETPNAIVYGGVINVFYHDVADGMLRHAWSDTNGANWNFETLDGGGGVNGQTTDRVGLWPSSSAFGSTLQLFYYDYQAGTLRHAWADSAGWHFENLDGSAGSISKFSATVGDTSAVTQYNSTLQLYYYDSSNGNLRHAWADATGWHFENLDGSTASLSHSESNIGRNPALAIYNNQLELFYYDSTNGNLRHAWTNPSGWHFENLDGDPGSIGHQDANLGITPAVTVMPDGLQNILYVFYYNSDSQTLKQAYANSTGWHFGTIDGSSFSASFRSSSTGLYPAAMVIGSTLQLFYYDNSETSLRHAFGPLIP